MIVVFIVLMILAAIVYSIYNVRKQEKVEQKLNQKKEAEKEATWKRLEELSKAPCAEKTVLFEYMGRKRSYVYDDVKLYIVPGQEPKFTELDPGDDLSVVQEPTNEYDNRAVYFNTWHTARAGCVKVGYIRKGKLQDMINDYIGNGYPVTAFIKSVDDDEGIITVCLAFYKDLATIND